MKEGMKMNDIMTKEVAVEVSNAAVMDFLRTIGLDPLMVIGFSIKAGESLKATVVVDKPVRIKRVEVDSIERLGTHIVDIHLNADGTIGDEGVAKIAAVLKAAKALSDAAGSESANSLTYSKIPANTMTYVNNGGESANG